MPAAFSDDPCQMVGGPLHARELEMHVGEEADLAGDRRGRLAGPDDEGRLRRSGPPPHEPSQAAERRGEDDRGQRYED